jgi:lipopolysaccharide/colanic/teichoic acid biosynthesis glycosyltransferase
MTMWIRRLNDPRGIDRAHPYSKLPPRSIEGPWLYAELKQVVDSALALPLLLLFAPAILVAMLAIKATSRGPALYRQVRTGRHGRRFLIYKLRTMYVDCERETGAVWSTPDDPRVTPIGRFLRRTHIDEFPQLLNVLRGEMALVGPRPERPEMIAKLERQVPCYRDRLEVRPGLSGLAQVFLPPDLAVDDVRHKLAFDLLYVARMGPMLDLKVLLCTAAFLTGVPFRTSRRCLGLTLPPRSGPGLGTLVTEDVSNDEVLVQ